MDKELNEIVEKGLRKAYEAGYLDGVKAGIKVSKEVKRIQAEAIEGR